MKSKIQKVLLLIFIISIPIDLYNGYVQNHHQSETFLPILYKGLIIIIGFISGIKSKKVLQIIFGISFLIILTFCYWILCNYSSLVYSLTDMIKLAYPYAILMWLFTNKNDIPIYKLLNYIALYGVLISLSIIITQILGIGISSYGQDYGYGTKGLFKAGNDISVALIMCNCIIAYLISKIENYKYIIYHIIVTIGSLMIGSTAGIIGVAINYLSFILQYLFFNQKITSLSKFHSVLIILIAIPIFLFVVNQIINTDSYTQNKYSIDRLTSGDARNGLTSGCFQVFKDYSAFDYLFGLGKHEFSTRIGITLYKIQMMKNVEVDHYDLIGSYGLLLGGILLFIPILSLIKYIKTFMVKKTIFCYWMIIATSLFIFHGLTAGHAFTGIQPMTVMVGIIYLQTRTINTNNFI